MSNVLETKEFLSYAERSWPTIPLQGKEPNFAVLKTVYNTTRWAPLADRPATVAEVREWLKCDPNTNIGIIMGDLAVADVDHPAKLNGHGFPPTPWAKTGRGFHVYFATNGKPLKTQSFSWGELKTNGYCVAPPSVHENGKVYEWFSFLSPSDVDLAEIPDWLLESLKKNRPDLPPLSPLPLPHAPRRIYSSRGMEKGVYRDLAGEVQTWASLGKGAYGELAGDWETAKAILKKCGADPKAPGKAFLCPLHAEERPSAALWKPEGGFFGFHDFHCASGREWFSLPEVYCSVITGEVCELGPGEKTVWWLRALHDIGAIEVPEIPCYPIPKSADFSGTSRASIEKVYQGFVYLLRLRRLYEQGQKGTPYTFTFAAGWCGLSCHQVAGRAVTWLMKNGYIRRVGETEKPGRFGKPIGLLALGKPREPKGEILCTKVGGGR